MAMMTSSNGTFSALLAICAGNSPVSGEFTVQRPETRSLDVFFDLCPNKLLSKQSWGWWFETPSGSLWRHSNEYLVVSTVHKTGVVWECVPRFNNSVKKVFHCVLCSCIVYANLEIAHCGTCGSLGVRGHCNMCSYVNVVITMKTFVKEAAIFIFFTYIWYDNMIRVPI